MFVFLHEIKNFQKIKKLFFDIFQGGDNDIQLEQRQKAKDAANITPEEDVSIGLDSSESE